MNEILKLKNRILAQVEIKVKGFYSFRLYFNYLKITRSKRSIKFAFI